MAVCAYIPECDFYHDKLDEMPFSKDFMKSLFCHKQAAFCARYLYLSHKDTVEVPRDLMPHETDKAKEFLRNI